MKRSSQDRKLSVAKLSAWYLQHLRKLPWRESHDPYRIWISEVMLQQTQVATVIPYYLKFLAAFPTVEALAKAPEETVLAHWAGLGYYSRARNLQKGAHYLVENHRGKFPKTRDEILKVPGIGPYTAGAVLSIAFDLPVPLVDGNVQRVFSRFFGIEEVLESKGAQLRFWQEAESLVKQADSPRVFNQALMELGAMVCTKGKPDCDRCPLNAQCFAREHQRQAEFPHRKARRATLDLYWIGLVYEQKERFFLKQNQKNEWWHGLWDFPHEAFASVEALHSRILELEKTHGELEPLQRHKHTVTHHRIHLHPYRIPLKKQTLKEGRWVSQKELSTLPVSALTRKVSDHLIP